MARRTIQERIAQLEAQRKALENRLGKQERARDTRRKVLLGALVLQRLETAHDPAFTQRLTDWLRRELPGFLTRDADKVLFADLIGSAAVQAAEGSNSRAEGVTESIPRLGDEAA